MPAPTAVPPQEKPNPATTGQPSAPSPKPLLSTVPERQNIINEVEDAIDAAADAVVDDPKPEPSSKPAPKPKQKEQEKPEPEKAEEDQQDDPDDLYALPKDKKDEKKEEAPKPEKQPEERPQKVAQLRSAYETLKRDHEALKKEYETAKSAPKDDSALKTIAAERDEIKTRLEKAEEELRYTSYQKSQEFREKFEAPIQKAFNSAYSDMENILVQTDDGGSRVATAEDFNSVLRIANLQDAVRTAKEMFGDAAPEVLAHRRKIIELSKASKDAAEDYRKNGSEREKQMQAKNAERAANNQKAFVETRKSIAESRPDLFGPSEDDPEGNKWLEKGEKFAETVFNPPEGTTDEGVVKLHAEAYQRIRSFPRLVHKTRSLESRIKELEAKLSDYESSEPGPGKGGEKGSKKGGEASLDDIYAAIDAA